LNFKLSAPWQEANPPAKPGPGEASPSLSEFREGNSSSPLRGTKVILVTAQMAA
jgi:hypothetical protein